MKTPPIAKAFKVRLFKYRPWWLTARLFQEGKLRKRAVHLFIHKVRDEKLSIRSILRMIDAS
jgi:hypothetical protein